MKKGSRMKICPQVDRMATERVRKEKDLVDRVILSERNLFTRSIEIGNKDCEECYVECGTRSLLLNVFPDAVERAKYLTYIILDDMDRRSRGRNISDEWREQLRENAKRMVATRVRKNIDKKVAVYVDEESATKWSLNDKDEKASACNFLEWIKFADIDAIRGEVAGYPKINPKNRHTVFVSESCRNLLRDVAERNGVPFQRLVAYFVRHSRENANGAAAPAEAKKSFDIGGTTVT